jgi:hypothetical protein
LAAAAPAEIVDVPAEQAEHLKVTRLYARVRDRSCRDDGVARIHADARSMSDSERVPSGAGLLRFPELQGRQASVTFSGM